MSTETAWVIGLPADLSTKGLVEDIHSAAGRAAKAEPGDRLDIARFEQLATRLEQAALRQSGVNRIAVALPEGGPTILFGQDSNNWSSGLPKDILAAANTLAQSGLIPVLVVAPHAHGTTDTLFRGAAEPPADTWEADEGIFGGRAVEARFRAQIAEALNPDAKRRVPISPSGINNAVVTEILREFVATEPGMPRVDAPVQYRDGSKATHPFPLRALPMRADLSLASLELRFTLLSIRHTEMDAVVHGAWLRNAEISRPRPAAMTDDLVYELSLRQLEELCRNESHVRLHMYQTGLETAIVGFYRALTSHLLMFPGSVSVQPMYYVAPRKPKANPTDGRGTGGLGQRSGLGGRNARNRAPARSASRHICDSDRSQATVVTESSTFRKGTPWTA
ncbi:hypothetical protein [Nostocoides jenkinsii]|uniref:Uncharacterized protein n=1 Tax=Nostocoides jenkinsii Ben 74 TaxID=1193518 RepID=A0A077MD93_9MICO|nr:hypothetical protein [Tetrasphaera jenkinsii]CCI52743.1 hypothetical protein BN13_200003 [Tetrasphaera jenkinsii Ben 74]